jgi:hypothetical protein
LVVKDATYWKEYRLKRKEVATESATDPIKVATATKTVAKVQPKARGLQPDGSFILSDGQVWHPEPVENTRIKDATIAYMDELRGDKEERLKRIEHPSTNVSEGIITNLPVIQFLAKELHPQYLESIRVGINGPAVCDVLEVIK